MLPSKKAFTSHAPVPLGPPEQPGDQDEWDMKRMGRPQQLQRMFGPWGLMGYASVTGAVWQYVLVTLIWSLPNGGASGALYVFMVCCVGMFLNTLSLAEMASMAPSAGGQYQWISEFAPRKAEKLLSYCIGWLTILGWQTGLAGVSYAAALQIQGLAVLTHPKFVFQGWHASLITIAVALSAVFFNTVLVGLLPALELVMMVLHFAAYFVFIFVLGLMGPTSTSAEVWNSWENENGWANTGTAFLVGIIAPIITLTSADSVCHVADELKDASRWLPRVMIAAAASNFAIAFALLIVILYRAGDIQAAVDSPTGQPYIEILLNATKSVPGTAVLVSYIVIALVVCATNVVTTSSRQLFSFARDHGVPFSHSLSQVSERTHVPIPAIACTVMATFALSLIVIGSSLAFNIITSIGGISLLGSYLVSISTIVYRRLFGLRLPRTRFSLGKFGLPINLATIAFDVFAFVMLFFPAAPSPTVQSMNWAVLIFGAVAIFALGFYFTRTKHSYRSPAQITRREDEIEMTPSREESRL